VFVVESSSVVENHNFQSVKSFLSDLVLDLAVDSGQTRVGLVTYAGSVVERFNLTRYSRRQDLRSAISAIPYPMSDGHKTATADAISYVRKVAAICLFTTSPQVVKMHKTHMHSADKHYRDVLSRRSLFLAKV